MRIKHFTVKSLLSSALMMVIWTSCIHQVNAAVATAKVTVKVVPAAAIHASERFNFSIPTDENGHQQTLTNSDQVEISSLSNRSSVTIKIEDHENRTYGLSISPETTLTGSSSADKITINNMNMDDYQFSANGDNEQELRINGELTMPESGSTGSYTGTTEITVNYN